MHINSRQDKNDLNTNFRQIPHNNTELLSTKRSFYNSSEEISKEESDNYISVSNQYMVPKYKSFIHIIKDFNYEINNFYNVEENLLIEDKNIVDDICECKNNPDLSERKIVLI